VAVDAKQRVILVAQREDSTKFCAEPSPDALAAIGASLAASGQYGEIETMLQAAIAESAGSFGVRNATIQFLRDGLYRLCEAYINGAIDEFEYSRMANKYEDIMVTLLAVEKLTSIADQTPRQRVVLNKDASVEGDGNEGNGGQKNEITTPNPTVVNMTNPALTDSSVDTISKTVVSLVRIMFDYWEATYSEEQNGDPYFRRTKE
jgi:hypothetical protein